MPRFLRALFLPCFAALALACGGSPSEPGPPDPPPSALECSDPQLATAVAQPFDRVGLSGIEGLDESSMWVEYESPAGSTGITALLLRGGSAEVVVPAHPEDLMGGGALDLFVTDGAARCGPLPITVAALPAASGDPVAELHASLDAVAIALAGQLGADPVTVAATSLDALPPQEVVLALLLEAVEAFDPGAAVAGMSADELAFTQALLAEIGLAARLDEVAASILELPATVPGAAGPGGPVAPLARAECGDLGSVPSSLFGLGAPQALSDYIKAARGANDSLGPLGDAIGSTGTAFAVMGLAVPPVGAIAGWAAFSASLVQQMRANLYPSAISRLEYQLEHTRIEEDWDTSKGDPEIRWSFAKVWATNNGMGLARVGLDFITTAAALPTGLGGAVADAATGALDIAAKDALNRRFDELGEDPDGGAECWGVGSTEFGPVVIPDGSGDQWVRAELTSGDAISIAAGDIRKLEPQRIGPATLRVRTQEEPFPGPFGYEDKAVEVLRKEVVWIPSTLLVEEPGTTMTIKFRVDNSRHNGPADVEVVPGPNLGTLPDPTFSGGVHTIELPTPAEEQDYPTNIIARSSSKTLPPLDPERSSQLDIFVNETIEISPRENCVPAGDADTLRAVVAGPGEPVVRWQIASGGGSLSATTGEVVVYTAPASGNGTATIRAWIEGKPEVEDQVSWRHGACTGLAVYYAHSASINFPFLPGGECTNPDADDEAEERSMPQGGLEPLVPPAPGDIWIDRSEQFSEQLFGSGTFGADPSGAPQQCITAGFLAEAGYQGSLAGSVDGSRLDIDLNTNANSNCEDMGPELGERCSAANSLMSVTARWDFEVREATSYRLQLNLSCDAFLPPGIPPSAETVSVFIVRVAPDGTPLPPNPTTQPVQVTCGSSNPSVQIDRVLDFAAPAEPGQVDHVMVVFQAQNASFGALSGDVGQQSRSGYLRGFVSLEPAGN